MDRITTQSLFSATTYTRSWKSYTTSTLVHVAILVLLLLVTVPVVREIEKPETRTTLLAPVLPRKVSPYKVKIIKPPHIEPKPLIAKIIPPRPVPQPIIKPPEIKVQPEVKPQIVAEMPKPLPPAPVARPVQTAKFDAPAPANNPAPRPAQVKTGLFGGSELAKGAVTPNQVKVGGFGDPHGVNPQANSQPSPVMMAKLGSFDMPNGAGNSGGGGASQNGGVRASGFGSATAGSGGTGSGNGRQGTVKTGSFGEGGTGSGPGTATSGGSVKTGSFGDSNAAGNQGEVQRARALPPSTPVEITFKPRPLYTSEARSLKLEGQVKLEVVFLASGSVRVVKVVQGLGHGLDQAAEQAAAQVHFRPATRDGVPIDTNATIYISFELS